MTNNSDNKMKSNYWMVGLGVVCTTAISVLGIWNDDEITLNTPILRDANPTYDREEFSLAIQKAIQTNFNQNSCRDPMALLSGLTIANKILQLSAIDFSAIKDYPDIEQEAFRRCESLSPSGQDLSTCFTIAPQIEDRDQDSFLASNKVLVEVRMSFRQKDSHRSISCEQIKDPENITVQSYYSLYWPMDVKKNQSSHHYRITGGVSSPLKEAPKHLSF